MGLLLPRLEAQGLPYAVAISGESGSGKTGLAVFVTELLVEQGFECVCLSQDDYFRLPPKANTVRRHQDLAWVGPGEVDLAQLNADVHALKTQPDQELEKPLIYFEEDIIGRERLPAPGPAVIVVEGTYVSLLDAIDLRVFVDRPYQETRSRRARRARETTDGFLERVLCIEHDLISRHREHADFVIGTAELRTDDIVTDCRTSPAEFAGDAARLRRGSP